MTDTDHETRHAMDVIVRAILWKLVDADLAGEMLGGLPGDRRERLDRDLRAGQRTRQDVPGRPRGLQGRLRAPGEKGGPLMTDMEIPPASTREILIRHQLRTYPNGAACKCGWTERIYGSALWTPHEWEDHLEDVLDSAGLLHDPAEVKSMCETAGRVAYALGRKEAGEELADKIATQAKITQRVPVSERSGVREGMLVAWISAEKLAREYASQPSGAVPASSGTPEDIEARKTACPNCGAYGGKGRIYRQDDTWDACPVCYLPEEREGL